MSKKTLDDYFSEMEEEAPKDIKSVVPRNDITTETRQTNLDAYKLLNVEIKTSKINLINQLKIKSEKGKRELEAAKVVFDTQLNKLKHQAKAAERESKTYWDAKSAEVAETIKNYVQSTLRVLENERLDSRNEAIKQAYERTSEKLDEVISSNMPEFLKKKLLFEMNANLEKTVDRINNESIAEKYDLK